MAAPPPPHNHPIAVDDDDGFDWEAAVREIDNACGLASASAATATTSTISMSAPGPNPSATAAPFHRSSAGGARQSTLDRFVDSFTRRQLAKERAPPAPAVAAAAVAPTGGGGRPGVRADGGCSRKADREEVVEEPCAVALDHEAVQTWIYPTNIEVREYQRYIAQKALFTNH